MTDTLQRTGRHRIAPLERSLKPREEPETAPEELRGPQGDEHLGERFQLPDDPALYAVALSLRSQQKLTDDEVDAIYPEHIRALSAMHWTPVDVARRAAEMLVHGRDPRILDVGSGAGKFSLVASLHTGAIVTGVEQRASLVALAQAVAGRYGADRARYAVGDMRDIDWGDFDAFYLFNPFGEHVLGARDRIDETVEFSKQRYSADIDFVGSELDRRKLGTRVVTYHIFGGRMPAGYECIASERCGTDYLECWDRVSMG